LRGRRIGRLKDGAALSEVTVSDHSPSGLRLLVVDDNRDVADSFALLLGMWGHEVRVAYDGASGLAAAREWHPDCLISDISMPRMDGYEVARAVRSDPTLSDTKLVAVSAFSDHRHVARMKEVGFEYRLTKPPLPDKLKEVLTMIEHVKELADKTKELAARNVELAGETKELLSEVKEELKEVKQDVRELKQEVRELKADRVDESST
jgi:two-component system OmpR family response regulator